MNVELSAEAAEYGRLARRALEAAGGDLLAPRSEADPAVRADVAAALDGLGAWGLDPRSGGDELEAAAALCHSAGWWGAPYPVAERLCRPAPGAAASDVDGLVVVSGRAPEAPLDGLGGRWATVSVDDGRRAVATLRPPTGPPRKTVFVTGLDLAESAAAGPTDGGADADADVALVLTLSAWTLLGMLDRAIDLTCAYVRDRRQFGQALASFQGVQFQLTEAEVERAGVEELAKYALVGVGAGRPDALADALALRLAALEAAEVVFRVTHQLHGAIGFCDESTLSWLSRHSQPLRRLPLGPSATRDRLARQVGRTGLAGLFDTVGSGWAT